MIDRFRDLHRPGQPLLMPNPWDAGSARILASLGFEALATTSSGFAATLGRLDGTVTRDEALAHASAIVDAVDVPVSADLEQGFADDPDGVAETIRGAIDAGLAGCSIEDWSATELYGFDAAVARIEAAVAAGEGRILLTARAENLLHGVDDLDDTIARLSAYAQAGADCVYAPGLKALDQIETVVKAVGVPVNVLALPSAPTVAELASVGVARISVGGGFAWAAAGGLVDAAVELRDQGTYGFWEQAGRGGGVARKAFKDA
jgi:2-methylisocitrate lyase-like PEP mutase family enzyme